MSRSDSPASFCPWGVPCFTSSSATNFLLILLTVVSGAFAQVEPKNETLDLHRPTILDSIEIDLGDRSIFLNRIEPPVLKPSKVDLNEPEALASPTPLTPEEQAEAVRWEQMNYETFYPSATAYEGKGSEVFVWTQDGGVRVLSSIDFRYFQPIHGFEGDGVYYSTFFMLDLWAQVAIEEAKQEDPTLVVEYPVFPKEVDGISRFEVVSGSEGEENAKAIAALEALHVYFDENRAKVIKDYEEAEAARLAHEKWLNNNPAVPQNTVINYFPVRSVYAPKEPPGAAE